MHEIKMDAYENIENIGRGEYGDVQMIKEIKTGKILAAKISHNSYSVQTKQEIDSIIRSINHITVMNHPSFLKYYGYSKRPLFNANQCQAVFFMDYAPNKSIQDLKLLDLNLFNPTKKLILVFGIAAGMKFLHEQNITHKNLKASNILLTNDFLPKISDFGFPKRSNSNGEPQNNLKKYLAPEILEQNLYSQKSDVFAFGTIVNEIMTEGNSLQNDSQSTFSLGDAYKNLIDQCRSPNPVERPTFKAIVEELSKRKSNTFITSDIDTRVYFHYVNSIKNFGPPSRQIKNDLKFFGSTNESNKSKKPQVNSAANNSKNLLNKNMTYRLVLVGNSECGKSNLVNRIIYGEPLSEYAISTVGVNSNLYHLSDDIKILIFDTAGQERFRNLFPQYVHNADIILVCYDIKEELRREQVDYWLDYLTENAPSDCVKIICALKKDLLDANEEPILVENTDVSVSSFTGEGIDDLLKKIKEAISRCAKCKQETSDIVESKKACC